MEDTIEVEAITSSIASSSSPTIPPPSTFSRRLRTSHTYYTAREAEIGIETESEAEEDITTDSGEDTEDMVDSDDGGDFNPNSDDEDLQDLNMD